MTEMFFSSGLDVPALLIESGMDINALNDSQARYTTQEISRLWELAALRSNNPMIGLAKQDAVHPSIFGVVAYAMMSSDCLFTSLKNLAYYVPVTSDATTFTLTAEGDDYWLVMNTCDYQANPPRQRVEFNAITVLNFCRWITRSAINPVIVELAYPMPTDIQPYLDTFRCPVRFNAAENRMLFARADLARTPSTANPALAALHTRCAGEQLDQLRNGSISGKVRALIIAGLAHGKPFRAEIAHRLNVSERTLQRRLHEAGTSFEQLQDNARHDLAIEYLSQNSLTVAQVGQRLAFADQSAFFRACKRWFDMPPKQFRTLSQLASDTRCRL